MVIEIGDIQPLARNFFSKVAGYAIFHSTSRDTGFEEISGARIAFSPPAEEVRLRFINIPLPESTRKYFRVRPFDPQGNFGDFSNPVEKNFAPTASISANPTTGRAPLTVNFDASASNDSDGAIFGYERDF